MVSGDVPLRSSSRSSSGTKFKRQEDEREWESGPEEDGNNDNKSKSRIMVIDRDGDLTLQLLKDDDLPACRYRVSSEKLQKGSDYFAAMLAEGKFSEGAQVRSKSDSLKTKYGGDLSRAPAKELPVISFPQIESIPTLSEITIRAVTVLLFIVHGHTDPTNKRSIHLLAQLAAIAEQVFAVKATSTYVKQYLNVLRPSNRMSIWLDSRNTTIWLDSKENKVKWRQLAYIGYIYNDSEFFSRSTRHLITYGLDTDDNEASIEHRGTPDAHQNRKSTKTQSQPPDHRSTSEIDDNRRSSERRSEPLEYRSPPETDEEPDIHSQPPWLHLPNDIEGIQPPIYPPPNKPILSR